MKSILLLPGDGIGPEVVTQAARVLGILQQQFGLDVQVHTALIGGASIDAHGAPLTIDILARARESSVVILGAVGGPQWNMPFNKRPEQGLLDLRTGLNLFANLRPVVCFSALSGASSLKAEVVTDLNLLIVRELIGGVYFGEPRGIEVMTDGQRRGFNTQVYTTSEIHRVAHVAFKMAQRRKQAVCSVDKSNVMESGMLWREEVTALKHQCYPDVVLSHMYSDNCAMQLVKDPRQFDVVLTDNLFGDLLSDEAAMLTGSLGMLPSASIGNIDRPGLYEPIHGSAPDIVGKGVANPCATILSLGMALRWQLDRPDLADGIDRAVGHALSDGLRTRDLRPDATHTTVGTIDMASAVIDRIAI